MYKLLLAPMLLIILSNCLIAQPEWIVNLTLQADGETKTLGFGGDATGTNDYDPGLDVLLPPPPPGDYYPYFHISNPDFTYLRQDIRAWVSPYDTGIDWTLVITNAVEIETTISWDPNDLPAEGYFTLVGGSSINMRTQSSAVFQGNQTLTIRYRFSEAVLGDVNGDGEANSFDALIILSCDVEINVSQFCPLNCGDTNDDDYINSTDALIILSYDVGISVEYPLEEPGCPTSVNACPGCNP